MSDKEAKQLPGFSRYNVYPDGTVIDKETGQKVEHEKDYLYFYEPYVTLKPDKGERTTVMVDYLLYRLFDH